MTLVCNISCMKEVTGVCFPCVIICDLCYSFVRDEVRSLVVGKRLVVFIEDLFVCLLIIEFSVCSSHFIIANQVWFRVFWRDDGSKEYKFVRYRIEKESCVFYYVAWRLNMYFFFRLLPFSAYVVLIGNFRVICFYVSVFMIVCYSVWVVDLSYVFIRC